jgi:hypothetical protein
MIKTITTIICDIEKCKTPTNETTSRKIQCIFLTDQTEGRSSKKYLDIKKIDICSFCYEKILNGSYILAHGAQGFNTYSLK